MLREQPARILLIEDDLDLAALIHDELSDAGHHVTISTTGRQGVKLARNDAPDLVILDLGLPDCDGCDVIAMLNDDDIAMLVVSGYDSVERKVAALEAGAKDYLIKPFHFGELRARVEVQLRHLAPGTPIELGSLTVDFERRQVRCEDQDVGLSEKEFDVLACLLRHPGRVFAREELLRSLWLDCQTLKSEHNIISVHIANIRAKFREHHADGVIRTVWGQGYVIKA